MAGENGLGELQHAVDELAGQLAGVGDLLFHVQALETGGFAQTHDGGNVLGAGTAALFLTAAGDQLVQQDALADIDGAHALGGVDLVAGNGQNIDVHGLDVHRHMAVSLDGVGVEDDALFAAQLADLGDGVDGADLVVGEHDAHHGGVGTDGSFQLVQLNHTVLVDLQIGDLKAFLLQSLRGVQDGVMLDVGGDQVLLALVLLGVHPAAQGHVVRLAAAAGEVDLAGLGVHQQGDLLAGLFHSLVAGVAQGVQGAGVAVLGGEEGHHFFQNAGIDGGGCRVVSVYETVFHRVFISFQRAKRP